MRATARITHPGHGRRALGRPSGQPGLITDVDLPALLRFLAVNTVVALALEAVPEELVFRGSILWDSALVRARMACVCLVLARVATGSIWTSVGAYLSFLTVNRIVYPGRADTGVTTSVDYGTELLVMAHLVLAIIIFATMLLPRKPDASAAKRQTGPIAAPGRGEAPAVLERERR